MSNMIKSHVTGRLCFLLLVALLTNVFAFTPFKNFHTALRINDVIVDNNHVWATTGGGLMHITLVNDNISMENKFDYFPDISLTTLCKDDTDNIWIGSKKGYLTKRSSRGKFTVYSPYALSNWDINDLYAYGKYLIVASSKGCSVFDTKKGKVFQNAPFESNAVTLISVFKDTLYLACDYGVYKLDISNNKIATSNFYDEGIWLKDKVDSTIVSFPIVNNKITYRSSQALVWNNTMITVFDSSGTDTLPKFIVFKDTSRVRVFGSRVTTLVPENERYCWVGTEENFLYRWDGRYWKNYFVNDIRANIINRIHLAKNGDLWFLPRITWIEDNRKFGEPWWLGIARFSKDQWYIYNRRAVENFESFGDGAGFLGISEGPSGNMWFGTSGKNIRKWNNNSNRWSKYYIGTKEKSTFSFIDSLYPSWGKCDALAQDSAGYMWFTAYEGNIGSVCCFDPTQEIPDSTDFRYFFPTDSIATHMLQPQALHVDAANNIYLGSDQHDHGRLVVFRYENGKNPIENGINVIAIQNDLSNVYNMSSTTDSCTWIATNKGLFHSQYTVGAKDTNFTFLEVKNIPTGLTCVEVEKNRRTFLNESNSWVVKTDLWVGTLLNGAARISITKTLEEDKVTVKSFSIDTIVIHKDSSGLIDNRVTDMALDRKNAKLWIATQNGLSQYDLGHSFEILTNNERVSAYPNPFILSRHNEVAFENLAPNSQVSIYTIDGRLITHLKASGSNYVKHEEQWVLIWKPSRKVIPGTYIYTAKIYKPHEETREKAIPGKLLILP